MLHIIRSFMRVRIHTEVTVDTTTDSIDLIQGRTPTPALLNVSFSVPWLLLIRGLDVHKLE